MKQKLKQEEKRKNKETKIIKKFITKKEKQKYITKQDLKHKFKNSQIFVNVDKVLDNGIIKLKDNSFAKIYSVGAIDLSLTSNFQKQSFFQQLKFLYQINNLNLRIYKLDDKIDLSENKDYYNELINKYINDKEKKEFLEERMYRLEQLEQENLAISSRYYFVVIADDEIALEKVSNDIETICSNLNPRLDIENIQNKLEIYQFLINLYGTNVSLEQLMWSNLTELITPYFINENINYLKLDEEEAQVITIKNIPPFVDELFFEQLFNSPNIKSCIHIKDTITTEELIKRLDSNYEFLISERNTTRKLSDATEMDLIKENMQILMNDIKNGDEVIKEVDFIVIITGNKKEREEKFRELKKLANSFKIKLDIPRMRQLEGYKAFDISKNSFEDYHNYLPSLTLASSFPLTITNFNDRTGYIWGIDTHTLLPIIFDLFYKDSSRPSSNLAIISSTGGGKSFALKKLIVNEINRGNKCFIFDAEGEYENLVKSNNGQYIDLYSSSGGVINPLQVRFLASDKEIQDENKTLNYEFNYEDCPLAKHLGSLETFIKCAFEEIKESEVVVMLDMIENLYKRFGITKNTKISYLEKLENTDYPIFKDLIEFIPDYRNMVTNQEQLKIIDKLEILLDRFNVGIDSILFNGYTTVNLDSDLIAFNVKDLLYSKNTRLITTQLVNLLTYLNNIIVKNKMINDKSKEEKCMAIIVDEFHLYLKINNEVILSFEQLARRIRKYNGAFIPATQSIHDFLGDDESVRSATAIFNNSQYLLVGMLKEDDLTTYIKLFNQNPLTDTQKEFLIKAEQGNFLLSINSKNRLKIKIIATPKELEIMQEVKNYEKNKNK